MKIVIFIMFCGLIGRNNLILAQAGFNYPITLSAPYHLDTIDNKRPTLIWQCDLSTIMNDPRVDMQMTLVEKQHGQSISEALIMNSVLYSGYGINDASFPFPSSEPDLIAGHTYAWQVNIMMNGSPIMQSEQWEFTIKEDTEKEDQYIKLATNLNNTVYKISSDKINFVIEDKGKLIKKCSIRKTVDGNQIWIIEEFNKKNTNRDVSYYELDIVQVNLSEGNYVLEVLIDNKIYAMQFYYVK